MKHLLLIVAICSIFKTSHGQINYLPDGTQWRVHSTYVQGSSCVIKDDILYQINGDTIVNGVSYKLLYQKVFRYNVLGNPFCGSGGYITELKSLLRQNGKEVMAYSPLSNGPELLLFDFDLKVGDSIFSHLNQFNKSFIDTVTSIDSILVNGENRARYWTDSTSTESIDFLIEGVGHNKGLLEPMVLCIGCSSSLNCFKQDSLVTAISIGNPCNFDFSIHSFETDDITVAPNPFNEFISVEYPIQKKVQVNFYEINGKLVKTVQTDGNSTISTSDLPNGVYTLEFVLDGQLFYKKLIKAVG